MSKKNWGKYKTGNRSGSTNCVGFFSLVLFFVVFFFPEIRGAGTGLQKKFFFQSKNKGEARAPPGPSPRSATVYYMAFLAVVPKKFRYASIFLSVTYKSKESWSLEKK